MKKQNVCEQFSEDLMLFAYDELPQDRKKELRKHLTCCLVCQTELARLKLFRKKIRSEAEIDELPESFWESNLESIREKSRSRSFRDFFRLRLVGSIAVACVIAVALLIGTRIEKNKDYEVRKPATIKVSSNKQIEINDKQIVAQMEVLENLDVLENILNIVEKDKVDQG